METPSNQSRPLSLKEAYLQRRAELDRSLGIATTEDNAPASTTSPVAAATAGTNASDPVNDKQQEMVPSPDGAAPASPALAGPDATVDATPVPLVAQDDIGLDVESLPAVVVEPPLTEDGATAQEVPVADNMVPEGVEHPALPTAGEVSEPEPHGAPDVGISDAPDLGQQLPDTPLEDVTSPVVRPIETVPNEHIITVPLAANVRKTYDEVVVNSQEIIEAFSTAFTTEEFHMPDPALVNKIDRMFQQLWDICDLPNFNDSIPLRNSHEVMRHATNTNSKFSFIYELLLALRGANRGILIVARRDHSIHNIIEAIATEEGFQHTIVGLGGHQVVDGENPRVTIAGPEDDISAALEANETVIAFDHVSRPAVLKQLAKASLRRGTPAPRMLSLVATYSIEHLDLHFPADMDPLDRRNALVVSLVQIRDLLADTGIKAPLPHDLASLFADFILNPSDEFEYSPQAIPDYACDVYSTQPRAANLNATELDEVKSPKGRKRQLVRANCSCNIVSLAITNSVSPERLGGGRVETHSVLAIGRRVQSQRWRHEGCS